MCDMQNMPSQEDGSCEENPDDMNFATFSTAGTHFVTTGGQIPVTKIQQGVSNNGSLQQVVGMVGGMGDGVQYVRAIDTNSLQTPQLISVPIALPGSKPGDPQQTVQIQVLNPNMMQQQQPKYQMQIPIQGFQQGAVLTLAYSPDDAGGIQLLGNSLPEGTFRMGPGLQLLMPQDMQMVQQAQVKQDTKEAPQTMHQVFITPNQQIVINNPCENNKSLNNNNNTNNNNTDADVIIKEELVVDDNMAEDVDESSQGTVESEDNSWQTNASGHADLLKYLNTLPVEQAQSLPVSLQQYLRMNPDSKKMEPQLQIEIQPLPINNKKQREPEPEPMAEAVVGEDGVLRIKTVEQKKKKYKKRPTKPTRPKPGQVVIAQASDGTPIYCCPECQMAYPEKEQLEMHLIVHKIERRFICGICGAGLKRKEHLERHKLGHNPERPYVCGICCKGFKRREHLNLHTVIHSGVKTEMCGECGKGFYRKDHLRKHTRSHETRRLRDEAQSGESLEDKTSNDETLCRFQQDKPTEITIHVPTSSNLQVPVQIHIPQHVVSSLQNTDGGVNLEALLAQHS